MKLIIDIPKRIYDVIQIRSAVMKSELHQAVLNGIPLEDIKTEIQKALDEDKATDTENAKVQAIALMWCLEVIDKYTGGTDENTH